MTLNDVGWSGDPADIVVAAEPDPLSFARRLAGLRPGWMADALCAGTDVATFFPGLGESTRHALELCGLCSVREPCLAEALADPSLDHGVRGGMSARARTAHRRAARARAEGGRS